MASLFGESRVLHLPGLRAFAIAMVAIGQGLAARDGDHWQRPSVAPGGASQLVPVQAHLMRVRTIGGADDFGSIDAVQSVRGQRIAVLDRMNARVSVFSVAGRLLSQFGRKGGGPGEFFNPVDLGQTSAGRLLVLSQGNQKISVLKIQSDSLVLLKEFKLPFYSGHMCVVGERIFVLGHHKGNLVHEIDSIGVLIRSFGSGSVTESVTDVTTVLGRMACSGTSKAIAMAPRTLGDLRVFSLDGETLWKGRIPNYAETIYTSDGISVRPSLPREGFAHETVALAWLGTRRLLVQMRRIPQGRAGQLEGRVFEMREGWSPVRPAWPRVMAQVGSTIYTAEDDPYPVLGVYHAQ